MFAADTVPGLVWARGYAAAVLSASRPGLTAQFAAPPVYLHGAFLLCEALRESGELTPALNLRELPSLSRDIYALLGERTEMRVPNWRELVPPEVVEQISPM